MSEPTKADVAKGLEQCKGIVNVLLEHEESGTLRFILFSPHTA